MSARSRVIWLALAALLLFAVLPAHAQEDVAGQVLARINQARAEAGIPPLARNGLLDAAAQGHADDLARNGSSLGHRGSDGSNMRERIARAGYAAAHVGENWAGYRSLDKIFGFWLNDPPHRRNILHTRFTEVGIGVGVRESGGMYIVTDFGEPGAPPEIASAAAVEPPAEPTEAPKKVSAKATEQAQANQQPQPTAIPPPPEPTPEPEVAPPPEPTAASPPPAPPPPAEIALVSPPVIEPAPIRPVKTDGGFARVALMTSAGVSVGIAEPRADLWRVGIGGLLVIGGISGSAFALAAARRGQHSRH